MNFVAAEPVSQVRTESRFYLGMSIAYLLIAFGGFAPTYWAPVATRSFQGGPIIHIHGLLLFTWTVFFFVQSALVAGRRVPDHRSWGLAGISLFSILLCSILVAQYAVLQRDAAAGYEVQALRFSAITLLGWPIMATLFALAIANIRRPEFHKRYMTLLMVSMMTPAIARVFITIINHLSQGGVGGAPPPPFVAIPPSYVGALLWVAALIHDWRSRGRVHPVYAYGAIPILLYTPLATFIAGTDAWLAFAKAFEHLAG